ATLERWSREVGGHALALNLLGTYLRDVRADLHELREVDLLGEDADRHAERAIRRYEDAFGPGSPETGVLLLMGFFDPEPGAEELRALRSAVRGVGGPLGLLAEDRAWAGALERVRRAGLIFAARDPARPGADQADAHPLVRGYGRKRLREGNDQQL